MTLQARILLLLEHGNAMYKGRIEEEIRKQEGHSMGDTTGRTLRLLKQKGKITKLEDAEGNTMYKIVRSDLPVRTEKVEETQTLFGSLPTAGRSMRKMGSRDWGKM